MSRYWLDEEFIDDGKTIDLISIGIVAEDGRELYMQSVEVDGSKASDWVINNVLSCLTLCPNEKTAFMTHVLDGNCSSQCPWGTLEQIRDSVLAFMDIEKHGKPELWGWCSAYDWVAFCQLFGTMMDLPAGYPHYMRDIQQVLDERGIPDEMLPQAEGTAHNALVDAQYIKKIWESLHL